MPALSNAALAVVAAGALAATIVDLRTRRIPNVLTAAIGAAGIVLAMAGLSGTSVSAALGGILLGLCLMLPGYAIGATGAGDVKYMAATGAVVGPSMVLSVFLFSAVTGGLLAVIVATRRRRLAATLAGTGRMVAAPAGLKAEVARTASGSRFAYGPAIAIGSLLAIFLG